MLTEALSTIGSIAIAIVVTIVIAGTQKYLSTRKLWQLGAIVPVVSLVIMGVIFWVKNIALSTRAILPCVILIVVELLVWIDGRRVCRRMELIKMKAKDM